MKTTTKTVYEAFDGTAFATAAECRQHEKDNAHLAIVGLTVEQALAIARREDPERAEAVEFLGKQIEKARLAAGDLRRRPSQASEPEPEPEPEAEADADDGETACTTCGVMFTGEPGQGECDRCAAESLADFRDAAGDARHEAARDRRSEAERP